MEANENPKNILNDFISKLCSDETIKKISDSLVTEKEKLETFLTKMENVDGNFFADILKEASTSSTSSTSSNPSNIPNGNDPSNPSNPSSNENVPSNNTREIPIFISKLENMDGKFFTDMLKESINKINISTPNFTSEKGLEFLCENYRRNENGRIKLENERRELENERRELENEISKFDEKTRLLFWSMYHNIPTDLALHNKIESLSEKLDEVFSEVQILRKRSYKE